MTWYENNVKVHVYCKTHGGRYFGVIVGFVENASSFVYNCVQRSTVETSEMLANTVDQLLSVLATT